MIFRTSMMKTGKTSGGSLRAFTLIELLLVLVLVAISIATITPRLSESVSGWQAKECYKNMLAAIQLARQLALVRQEITVFALDVDRGSFTVESASQSAGSHGTGNDFWVPRQFIGKDVKIVQLEGFTQFGSEKDLVFWPDGSTERAHITLANKKDSKAIQWHIFVEDNGAATGRQVSKDE